MSSNSDTWLRYSSPPAKEPRVAQPQTAASPSTHTPVTGAAASLPSSPHYPAGSLPAITPLRYDEPLVGAPDLDASGVDHDRVVLTSALPHPRAPAALSADHSAAELAAARTTIAALVRRIEELTLHNEVLLGAALVREDIATIHTAAAAAAAPPSSLEASALHPAQSADAIVAAIGQRVQAQSLQLFALTTAASAALQECGLDAAATFAADAAAATLACRQRVSAAETEWAEAALSILGACYDAGGETATAATAGGGGGSSHSGGGSEGNSASRLLALRTELLKAVGE